MRISDSDRHTHEAIVIAVQAIVIAVEAIVIAVLCSDGDRHCFSALYFASLVYPLQVSGERIQNTRCL